MVIASGRSTRQVASMAHKLAERIKAETGQPVRIEGLPTADWVLVDAGDIIVHLFRPEVRSFYNLERMWAFGEAPAAPRRAAPKPIWTRTRPIRARPTTARRTISTTTTEAACCSTSSRAARSAAAPRPSWSSAI